MIYHRHVVGTSVIQYRHDEKQIDRSQRNHFWRMGKKPHANVGNDSHQPMEASYFGANKLIAQWFLQQGKSLPQANRKLAPLLFSDKWPQFMMGLKKLLNLKLCSYVRAEVCGLVELWLNFIRKHGEHTHVVGNQKVFEASWLYKKPELEADWGRVNSMDQWILDFT